MKPIKLQLSGFLSYRQWVEVDFSSFHMACVSGHNGAGKSSLLDAMTYALFGQARKTGEALIHTACQQAEVSFVFEYEQNEYRVVRILPRGKSTLLEFQVKDTESDPPRWRPLTEKSVRATEDRIRDILRLDYETFVNASFFLQGKADQFTQQRPGDRKRILASILGLDQWEVYREKSVEQRKLLERDLDTIDGRLAEVNAELAEEAPRRARLKDLETRLAELAVGRKAQESLLENARQVQTTLASQRKLSETLANGLDRVRRDLRALETRRAERLSKRGEFSELVERAGEIESAYQGWQDARAGLEAWEQAAAQFREQEKRRQPFLDVIHAERSKLSQEVEFLAQKQIAVDGQRTGLNGLQQDLLLQQEHLTALQSGESGQDLLTQRQALLARYREQAARRQEPLQAIHAERARLEQEIRSLQKQQETIETQRKALVTLDAELVAARQELAGVETLLEQKNEIEAGLQAKRHRQVELKAENERLKVEMDQIKDRIARLDASEGALCPLCGQPLGEGEREKLMEELRQEGKLRGDAYRANRTESDALIQEIAALEKELAGFGRAEKDRLFHTTNLSKITERLETNQKSVSAWDALEAARLHELQALLLGDGYALEARRALEAAETALEAVARALGLAPARGDALLAALAQAAQAAEDESRQLVEVERERSRYHAEISRLQEKIATQQAAIRAWQEQDQPRLDAVRTLLDGQQFALEARAGLQRVDEELKSLGYDAAAHEAARQAELDGRASEADFRRLEAARAALQPLDSELDALDEQLTHLSHELDSQEDIYAEAAARLGEIESQAPDLDTVERDLFDLQERENRLNMEVGGARQLVAVLESRRSQKAAYEQQRNDLALGISRYKTLERAFGKDGVPALLIEQALPQIEEKANQLLERLSNGAMSVRFVTQAEYKDKKRDDLRETLDIVISDPAGARDYEMFSGGEAFRVNFAIRLALSEILAQRTGARLQMLVIDEGFGSQDAQGIQRLVEAINAVKADFAKILIITHLEELKDAFSNRIEIEKSPDGSRVRVI